MQVSSLAPGTSAVSKRVCKAVGPCDIHFYAGPLFLHMKKCGLEFLFPTISGVSVCVFRDRRRGIAAAGLAFDWDPFVALPAVPVVIGVDDLVETVPLIGDHAGVGSFGNDGKHGRFPVRHARAAVAAFWKRRPRAKATSGASSTSPP